MEALHLFPARRSVLEAEDAASDFIEQELGRHDWMNNWPTWKQKHPDYRTKLGEWLQRAGYATSSEAVEKAIDDMILRTPGRWR